MSTRPSLSLVTRSQGANQALLDGEVAPPSVVLRTEPIPRLVHGFRRMVRDLAYDVSELALTTYLCARAHGVPVTALPVFLVRGLHHGAAVTSLSQSVMGPDDLEGRTVGVNRGYTVTTGVWARGVLQHEYGVDLRTVCWAPTDEEHVESWQRPDHVLPPSGEENLSDAVGRGEFAAAVGLTADGKMTRPLIENAHVAGWEALRRGFYPINHLIVVRDDVLAATPGLATELYRTFATAKDRYVRDLAAGRHTNDTPAAHLHRRIVDELRTDPLPYGLAPNLEMLEHLMVLAEEQEIVYRRRPVEELFSAETLDLADVTPV